MPQAEENNVDPLLRLYLLLDICNDVNNNNNENQVWTYRGRKESAIHFDSLPSGLPMKILLNFFAQATNFV